LSKHGIAVVQTTAIDEAAQLVKLTTVLAHSSGEWIASDWPVCPVKDTQTPHRMGMALTYARRYSLFALVGIAGEDDLDAPDLQSPTIAAAGRPSGTAPTNGHSPSNGHIKGRHSLSSHNQTRHGVARQVLLGPAQSAALRDRLLGEVNAIASADDGALWAYCNLRAKNGLTTADAQAIETAFQTQISTLAPPADLANEARLFAGTAATGSAGRAQQSRSSAANNGRGGKPRKMRTQPIDKTVLAFPEPRRLRDREHVRFVAKQPCVVCGRLPCDAHHLRFAQNRALGRKVSDEFTVPLCRGHHREVHRHGDEAGWWNGNGIDAIAIARDLWLQTHPQLSADNAVAVASATSPRGSASESAPPVRPQPSRSERVRSVRLRRSTDYKTKPITARASHDLAKAD
jgi:hypothetical protein